MRIKKLVLGGDNVTGKRFNPNHAAKLLNPDRQKLLPVKDFIKMLNIADTDQVADLGAGNGFFTIPFSEATHQTVYAVDIEPDMLEALKGRVEERGIENVEYLISNLESINLPDHCVEKVFAAFVMHEVPDLDKALSEIKRIMKPNGRAVILEWKKVDEVTMGPPNHHRLQSEDLATQCKEHGFHTTIQYPNDANFALVLELEEKE